MLRLIFIQFGLTFALSIGPPTVAQEDQCSHRKVTIYVQDSLGKPISGLTPVDFDSQFRGKPVKIMSVTPDQRPHRIVILLDASRSMAHKWEQALYLATHLIGMPLPNTQIALVVFDERIQQQVGFSTGRRSIETALQDLHFDPKHIDEKMHGKTALYDSLLAGLQLLGSPTSSDILYAITDAGDNSSHAVPKDVAKALTSSGVHLFVSLLASNPSFRNRTPEEIMGPEDLSGLVHKTGGKLITPEVDFPHDPKHPELFVASLNTFDLFLVDDYLVDIELPEAVHKYEDWTIKLSKENRERWKNAEVLNAKDLAPCQQ
jgi:hypothetical protein